MPKVKNAPERRTYNFEIRAMMDGNVGILTGRPIVYESRTDLGYFDAARWTRPISPT